MNAHSCRATMLLAALFVAPMLQAQSPFAASARWEGSISLSDRALGVAVDLIQSPGEVWAGDVDIPAQGLTNRRLSEISIEGRNVAFTISGVPGRARFEGLVSEHGDSLSGRFTQGGLAFNFELVRNVA